MPSTWRSRRHPCPPPGRWGPLLHLLLCGVAPEGPHPWLAALLCRVPCLEVRAPEKQGWTHDGWTALQRTAHWNKINQWLAIKLLCPWGAGLYQGPVLVSVRRRLTWARRVQESGTPCRWGHMWLHLAVLALLCMCPHGVLVLPMMKAKCRLVGTCYPLACSRTLPGYMPWALQSSVHSATGHKGAWTCHGEPWPSSLCPECSGNPISSEY